MWTWTSSASIRGQGSHREVRGDDRLSEWLSGYLVSALVPLTVWLATVFQRRFLFVVGLLQLGCAGMVFVIRSCALCDFLLKLKEGMRKPGL